MKIKDKSSNAACTDNILVVSGEDTLNDIISELGLSTEKAEEYIQKHVKSGNNILFTGKSSDVWQWLERMEYIERIHCHRCGMDMDKLDSIHVENNETIVYCPNCPSNKDENASLSVRSN